MTGLFMNFSTFFLFLFLTSISLCLGTTLLPEMVQESINFFNLSSQIDLKFIGIFSFIISTLSYIGLVFSYYSERKRARLRAEKIEQERKVLDKIHAELEALQKA